MAAAAMFVEMSLDGNFHDDPQKRRDDEFVTDLKNTHTCTRTAQTGVRFRHFTYISIKEHNQHD
jgi:hypothetical protein